MLGGVPHGAHTGGKAVEIALEGLEAHVAKFRQLAAVEMAVVKAQTSVQSPMTDVGRRRNEHTEVKQVIVGNQEFVALVERTLPHAAHAAGDAPIFAQAPRHVVDVVIDRVQLEVEPVLIRKLKLLATVLLVGQHGVEPAVAQVEGVIEHGLVVIHLLIGLAMVIGLGVGIGLYQFARQRVALALGDTGREVEIGTNQTCVTPCLVDAQHSRQGTLAELRVGHIAVTGGLIGVGELVAIADVP